MRNNAGRFVQAAIAALCFVLFSAQLNGPNAGFSSPDHAVFNHPVFSSAVSNSVTVAKAESPAVGSAVTLVRQGQQHYEQGQFSAAAQVLQQAAAQYQQSGDVSLQAQTLSLQALALNQLGQWDVAQAAIAQSFSLLSQPHTSVLDESRIRAQAFNARGHVEFATGQIEGALESWTSAETGYRQTKAMDAAMGAQLNQAQALQSLGFYRRAENLLNALEKDLRAEGDTPLKMKGLLSLGNVLRLGGEVERAQTLLAESLAIAQPTGDVAQVLLSLGNTERVLAKRSQAIQDLPGSEQHVKRAIDYYQAVERSAADKTTQIQAQLNLLSLLTESGRTEAAIALKAQLTAPISQLSPSRAAVYAAVNFAQCALALTPQQSLETAQQLARSIAQAQSLQDRRAESYALGTLGLVYEKSADFANATATTERALAIAKSIRADDIVYRWQWQLGRLLKNHDASQDKASAIAYYTDAVATLNELRSKLVISNPDIQFSFRESVEPVYRELMDLLLQAKQPSVERLKQVQAVLEALQLAELDNFFRDACARPDVVDIDQIDKSAAVIYPVVLPNRLAIILKLPGKENLYYASDDSIGEAQVDTVVKQFLSKLKRRSLPPSELHADAKQIYDWLIKPFAGDLDWAFERSQSKIKTLVFVLDGSLRNVPMAALYDGERYLVERYAIGLTPGLQLLSPQGLRQGNLRVLLAGATAAPSFAEAGLSNLDNVAFELAGVKAKVNRSTLLAEQDFQQSKLRDRIEKETFNVVHLATHGNFSSNPDETYLLDWDDRISANDIDTLFQAGDPGKSVELLVLSACETAAGDKRAALGLAGIAIRADVRSTLATLWQVNDTSTAEFMVRFYEQLTAGSLTKAEAVRAVQLAFLKDYADTDYDRPFHWAPFTLVGNWL